MNLKLVFRIYGVITLINAAGIIFATQSFFEMAGMTAQASGPPAYGNIVLMAVFAGLFFMYSKKS